MEIPLLRKTTRAAQGTNDGRKLRAIPRSQHEVTVAAAYRLDLTVSGLRRLSANVVDVVTPDGRYARALHGARHPVVVGVTQTGPTSLIVTIEGDDGDHGPALALTHRILGLNYDLAHFHSAAAGVPWLRNLASRMRGVRPPRYPTLWEACVNAIVFQQISLQAASAIMRRFVFALSPRLDFGGVALYPFPTIATLQAANDDLLRATGLSSGKLATLRRVGEALARGRLDEAMLEERSSRAAAARLEVIKGVGPWTAAVILIRGLARLDVFPAGDASVARNLAFVAGSTPADIEGTLRALSPQQGMLYYLLLLARLEAGQEIGRASSARKEPA